MFGDMCLKECRVVKYSIYKYYGASHGNYTQFVPYIVIYHLRGLRIIFMLIGSRPTTASWSATVTTANTAQVVGY